MEFCIPAEFCHAEFRIPRSRRNHRAKYYHISDKILDPIYTEHIGRVTRQIIITILIGALQ